MPKPSNAPVKLIRLLDYHERAAEHIRAVIEMLDADAVGSSTSRASATIHAAIGLDAMRAATQQRNGNGRGPGRPPKPTRASGAPHSKRGAYAKNKNAKRTASAALLATLDRNEPRPILDDKGKRIASFLRYGYIRRAGDGFVRTAKEFHV